MTSPLFGLYPQADFRLTDGRSADGPTSRAARWYFASETIAVPKAGVNVAPVAAGVAVVDDLRAWANARTPDTASEYPSLIWVGAPHVVTGARLTEDAGAFDVDAGRSPLYLVPKIPLNRSYFDASSAAFFRARTVKIRGWLKEGGVAARTLWPEDFRIEGAPARAPLATDRPAVNALRERIRRDPQGGARAPYAVSVLWQRDLARPAVNPGRTVLGIMVNGAQGDDDEAHAGHFALVTGRTGENGAMGDWLTNNFYSLDTESEKGIIAAPVPLDNYLADLNSGQGWYRPSHMIVAVLAGDRAASVVQAALNRVYNQFWRHQLVYRHGTMNCAGISVDVLRVLGWDIPVRGAASRLAAVLGLPWFLLKQRSFAKASTAFDYLFEDQTRLLPAAAFEEIGASLIALAEGSTKARPAAGKLARWIADDVESILFVRIPQFPSSRAFGDAPVVTPWEFQSRWPAEPQIVPVPDRPFPASLRDPDLLPPKRSASVYAAAAWALLIAVGIAALLLR